MNLSTALHQLRTMPIPFLSNNLLSIAGAGQTGQQLYRFGFYDNLAPGVNEGFKFAPGMIHCNRVGTDGLRSTALGVHNIRMNPNHEPLDVSAIPGYTLGAAGPDLMVTGQLSACIFAIRQNAGALTVAHIQPGGGRQTGTMLRQTINLIGRLDSTNGGGSGRVTHVFGLGTEYSHRAHVVGVRSGGVWSLYAQKVQSGMGPIQGPAVQLV